MKVPDGLPGGRPGVEADVIAVGPQFGVELALDLVYEGQDAGPFIVTSFPPGSDRASWHDEGVSRADREAIGDGERVIVRREPLRRWHRQERRVIVVHLGSSTGLAIACHGAQPYVLPTPSTVPPTTRSAERCPDMTRDHSSYDDLARGRRESPGYREGYAGAQRAFLIGQAVRERRLALGLSQVELAAQAG